MTFLSSLFNRPKPVTPTPPVETPVEEPTWEDCVDKALINGIVPVIQYASEDMRTDYIDKSSILGIIRSQGNTTKCNLSDFNSKLVDQDLFIKLMRKLKPWRMKYDSDTSDGESRDCDEFSLLTQGLARVAFGDCLVFTGWGYVREMEQRHAFNLIINTNKQLMYYEPQSGSIREWDKSKDNLQEVFL